MNRDRKKLLPAIIFLSVIALSLFYFLPPPAVTPILEVTPERAMADPPEPGHAAPSVTGSQDAVPSIVATDPENEPGFTLDGVILDARARPVAAAQVTLRTSADSNAPSTPETDPGGGACRATSDDDGRFRISELPEGKFLVTAETENAIGFERSMLSASRPSSFVTIVLREIEALAGRVVDARERPVAGASVRITHACDGQIKSLRNFNLTAAADEKGRFRFEVPKNSYRLAASAPGYGAAATEPLDSGPAEHIVRLEPGFVVRGIVTGEDVHDAKVVYRNIDVNALSGECSAGPDGTFEVADLAGGSYFFHAEQGLSASAPETVSVSAPISGLELHLEAAGTISGRIVAADGSGEGVPGLAVSARPATAGARTASSSPSDPSGAYSIGGLTPGTYFVEPVLDRSTPYGTGARKPGRLVRVQHGEEVLHDIPLYRGCSLRGDVAYPSGEPAAHAKVTILVSDPAGPKNIQTVIADLDGLFDLYGIPLGSSVYAFAEHELNSTPMEGPLQIGAYGIGDVHLILDLGADASISGVVMDAQRNPLALEVQVESSEETGGPAWVRMALSNRDGAFVIPNLRPGNYQILGRAYRDVRQLLGEVNVPASRHVGPLQLVYVPVATSLAEGTITDRAGRPVAEALVTVLSTTDGPTSGMASGINTASNSRGEFALPLAPEETAHVLVSAEGYVETPAVLDPQVTPISVVLEREKDKR